MGKSPGKWIKTVLFGKKNSKFHMPKGREKIGNEKAVLISAKGSEADAGVDFPDASNLILKSVERNEGRSETNSKDAENILPDGNISFPGNQYTETQGSTNAPYDPDRLKLEQAATKAQAAFRGYLARRAFWALKGIIRLQALIRGHLVRRQAVATLSSMLGIVKFQSLVRGRIVRHSDIGLEVGNKCSLPKKYALLDPAGFSLSTRMARFTANAFIFRLLATSPTVRPLHLQFDPEDQNSILSWIDRWSRSHFWRPIPQLKKQKESSKSQRKPSNGQTIDPHAGRSKRTRRLPVTNTDNASTLPYSEVEKPKRNVRKVPSHPPSNPVLENPQYELEKVKRSLRKVHNPVLIENPVQIEPEPEKPKEIFSAGHNNPLSEPEIKKEEEEVVVIMSSNSPDNNEPALESLPVKEILDEVTLNPNPLPSNPKDEVVEVELKNHQPEDDYKDENSPLSNGKLTQKEDPMSNENLKSSRKNNLNVPSYMAATESAKAKLRAQGSPRFGQEGERNNNSNVVRRHSLPSLTNNGKISSQSPRTQRVVQSGGKGGIKTDKSVPTPKDGHAKVNQMEWRR